MPDHTALVASLYHTGSVLSMTSKEVAELTKKEHKNVLRDIDNLLISLGSDLSRGISMAYEGDPAHGYRYFTLDRDSTFCLIAGYDAAARMRIIKRWQELEAQVVSAPPPAPQPALPSQVGKQIIRDFLDVAEWAKVPLSYALQVAGGAATLQTGLPWDRLLTQAEPMNNVPAQDVMLEPTELGKLFNLSGSQMNLWLKENGLQVKTAGRWEPTEEGEALCARHAWTRGAKSGYNLKWRAAEIEKRMRVEQPLGVE